MLGDGVGNDFAIARHSIHFYLLGVLEEAAHHDGVLLRYVGGQFEEALQFFAVGTNVHRSTRKHIRGTYEHGEAHLVDEGVDVFHRSQRAPFGLVHTDAVEQG